MKKLNSIVVILLAAILFLGIGSQAFANTGKEKEIKIKVFFHCGNGKALLEKELGKTEGVISAVADLQTMVVTIKYDPAKQDKDKLVDAIEKIGYTTEFTKEGTKINKACSHGEEGDGKKVEHKH
mgnify:CR=1 FL=1